VRRDHVKLAIDFGDVGGCILRVGLAHPKSSPHSKSSRGFASESSPQKPGEGDPGKGFKQFYDAGELNPPGEIRSFENTLVFAHVTSEGFELIRRLPPKANE